MWSSFAVPFSPSAGAASSSGRVSSVARQSSSVLLQARQRPALDPVGQSQPPPQVAEVVGQHAELQAYLVCPETMTRQPCPDRRPSLGRFTASFSGKELPNPLLEQGGPHRSWAFKMPSGAAPGVSAMSFTVRRSSHEIAVKQRLAGVSQLLGASMFAAVAWLLFGPSGNAEVLHDLGDTLPLTLGLSLLSAFGLLLLLGIQTMRYPVELVLDRARNRILVRFQAGTTKLDFNGVLSDVASFNLVDVETARYAALARADRLGQLDGLAPTWLNKFPALKEWAFRTHSANERIEAERHIGSRLSGLFRKTSDNIKPVRLRVTMGDGEAIMLPDLVASPQLLKTIAQALNDFVSNRS